MISKKFYDLCVKSVSGNINPDEDKLLKDWLLQSDENKNYYNEVKNVWERIGELKLPELLNKEKSNIILVM